MNILQKIFKEHYEEMKYTLHPRPSVIENVDKMINCCDPAFGGAMYGYSNCGELNFFLSAVKVTSVLLATTNTPLTVPLLCLLK